MDEKHPDETQRMIEAVEKAADYKRKEQWWYLFWWVSIPLARGFMRFVFGCVFILLVIGLFIAFSLLLNWLMS